MDKKQIISTAVAIIVKNIQDNEDESDEDDCLFSWMLAETDNYYNKAQPVRIKCYLEHTIDNYTNQEFQSHFRLNLSSFNLILSKIGTFLQRRRNDYGRNKIDARKQFLAVLWLLATPDSYRSVAERFDLGKSSLSVCFMRVVRSLASLASEFIKWPAEAERTKIEQKFFKASGVPGIVGAVDGTFIPIKAPVNNKEVYVTRKCNYAITLQAISDYDLMFTDVFVAYPGSVGDARIFRNSDIYTDVIDNVNNFFNKNEYIIGDKAYPILTWCIPPFIDRGILTSSQKKFNHLHAKARSCIERAFALLFGRFRRLKYMDMNRTDFIPLTSLACCVLHNACLINNDLMIHQYIEDGMQHIALNNNDDGVSNSTDPQFDGRNKRDTLCRIIND